MSESRQPIATSQRLRELDQETRSRVLQRAWIRLASAYGADRWERAYGANPHVWEDALRSCTVEDLSRGITAAEQDAGEWLPTVGKFVRMCKSWRTAGGYGAATQTVPALAETEEQRKARVESGRKHIREILAKLRAGA